MSTKRIPLSSSNPNVANSPMRAASGAGSAKKARALTDLLEEPYGKPPPAKRQMIDRGVASPSRASKTTRTIVQRSASRAATTTATTGTKASAATLYTPTEEELVNLRTWHAQIRSRFPKMVFYFESIPDEQRSKLAKQVGRLGAREEKFFSIDITHVVTTRPIPPEKPKEEREGRPVAPASQEDNEQPKTIDPSLLNRTVDPTRRKLVYDTVPGRRPAIPSQDDPLRRTKTRTDVLDKAREMGKKIWSLEKLQKILEIALNPEQYMNAGLSRGNTQSASKASKDERNLALLLQNERVNGPSDRDPTVASQDTYRFRGPYIYVYDVEEKTRPIMVREYMKASDPKDQEWPQFRIVSQGRCPFVLDESYDPQERENRDRDRGREKDRNRDKGRDRDRDRERTPSKTRVAKAEEAEEAAEPAAPTPLTADAPPKAATGKRTLAQMEDGHNRGIADGGASQTFDRSRVSNPPTFEFRSQNAFISHAKAGRLLAGEPVASGMQPSNVTSAIRSQMVSSTTGGVLGAKAGTSKEIHGLQRKVVLQKASTPGLSLDPSSRQVAGICHDGNTTFVRSASAGQITQRKLDVANEEGSSRQREKLRRTASVPVSQSKPRRDPKPGYCENCQEKFADFEEHIVSRKHRKFAENDENWSQLDALLSQLAREPRR
ncbi:hypothetical protein MYCTH_2306639 [Thermothelomyces thermophilus ATCC 42464]|uniref:DBF4-type domain-containing protein n=1 Tax=Thermothelomyces thermophilus (strain ATCC 42464 / BCRC 31852 / DSM 1799) TaxID=573729 RepID=G2QHP9_THET4|nr:uncharacterized protein MYCTH_2306639 [Thermothelomyces thermophilus ATCC 42464]AEO58909.1 hypothetical protein MYCTH_2306639 [Thermothelomyces thermophilus ATCC 42464]